MALGVAGAMLPASVLGLYNAVSFGRVVTSAYQYENPLFQEPSLWLGLFGAPRLDIALWLLVSRFRGLFVCAPVLVLGVLGLVALFRDPARRGLAILSSGLFVALLLINSSFNGWYGGYSVGPRYLIPALPFLALPTIDVVRRWPKIASGVAALSVALTLVVTAVDPQCPLGVPPWASSVQRTAIDYSPLTEYELPLFMTTYARPILRTQIEDFVLMCREKLQHEGVTGAAFDEKLMTCRRGVVARVAARAPEPLPLASYRGPVSVNPMGFYEPQPYSQFEAGSAPTAWASANAGEILFPQSRWSLVPLMLIWTAIGWRLSRDVG
jgi:hypothetical protein